MYVSRRHTISRKWACSFSLAGGMGWQRWVGSKNLYISFAEYCLFYRALLQKRSIILSILLTEVTPYDLSMAYMPLSWVVNWPLYRDAWLVWGRCKCRCRWGSFKESTNGSRPVALMRHRTLFYRALLQKRPVSEVDVSVDVSEVDVSAHPACSFRVSLLDGVYDEAAGRCFLCFVNVFEYGVLSLTSSMDSLKL